MALFYFQKYIRSCASKIALLIASYQNKGLNYIVLYHVTVYLPCFSYFENNCFKIYNLLKFAKPFGPSEVRAPMQQGGISRNM